MFSVNYRDRVRDDAIKLASSDRRVTACAVVGSLALGGGDRWSDLDLTFAVAEGVSLADVLEDWTRHFVQDFGAVFLFDLPAGRSIYRVVLLPDCLQLDLSFAPESDFAAVSPKFRLLFGNAKSKPYPEPPSVRELLAYAVHHVVRARFCIERGRYWHAEYWISGSRDYALSAACRRRGLPSQYGRGFDDLAPEARDPFENTLVRSLEPEELLRALRMVISALLQELRVEPNLGPRLEPELRKLMAVWPE
jgi:hypothetical protein